ncbi:MAG: YraN family protein [Oxalobacteraceae bacterium]
MTVALGKQAEDRALAYLVRQGLRLIVRNYRCRVGEIDLIMQDVGVLVFVEVRSRSSTRYGGAAASVGPVKQQRLWRTAEHYLMRYRHPPACRFDLVAMDGESLQWIRDMLRR